MKSQTSISHANLSASASYGTLKKLLDSSLDVVCSIDEDGKFIEVSAASIGVWGYTPEELRGKPYMELVVEDDKALTNLAAQQIISGKDTTSFENRYKHKDGTIVLVLWSARWDSGEKVMYCVARDGSERRKADVLLRESYKNAEVYSTTLQGIIENVGDGFYFMDKDFTVGFWNKKAEEFLGKSKEAVVGRVIWEVFPEARELKFYEQFSKAISENIPVQFEEYVSQINAWLDVSAYPTEFGLTVFFRSINEKKQREEELRISNERYHIATRATSDVLWDWDLATQSCYFSDGFTDLFGYSNKNDNIYVIWVENIHEGDKERVFSSVQQAIQNPFTSQWQGEYKFYKEDKTIAYVLDRGYIIRNIEGKAVRMVGSMQDITRLKEIEIELGKRERRFRTMVQAGEDMIALLNSDFAIEYLSSNYEAITGYRENEMKGVLGHGMIHPDDYKELFSDAKDILQKELVRLPPYRYKHNNGEYRWFETTLTNHLDNPDIGAIVSNTRDITTKKKVEDELQQLSLVAKETVNAVVITDATEKIVWVNQAFSLISEYSFKEALGRKPGEFLQGPKTCKKTKLYLKECVEQKLPFSCDILNYSKSGKEYWMEIKGQPVFGEKGELKYFFAIQIDITERKLIEQERKMSELKYKLLFHESLVAKFIFRLDDLKIVEVNNAAVKLYGYSKEEFTRLTLLDLKFPEDRVNTLSFIEDLKKKEKYFFSSKVRHKHKTGLELSIETTTQEISITGGKFILAACNDVTEKTKLEQMFVEEKINAQKEIAKAVIDAQERERSDIGKELHDNVNQLLTTIKLYIENIKSYPEQSSSFLDKSIALTQRAINEVRVLAKQLSTPVIKDLGFEATIHELVDHYLALNLFELEVCFEVSEERIERGMQLTIYRIIQEQLNNIVKYARASRVRLKISEENYGVRVLVEDDGVGFDTSKPTNGQGLNNIKNRSEVYKGKVDLFSSKGGGCSLTILFPQIDTLQSISEN